MLEFLKCIDLRKKQELPKTYSDLQTNSMITLMLNCFDSGADKLKR
jgi:hypothetical protein